MKYIISALCFQVFTSSALCQTDTVIINNLNFYQPGKVNYLKSPTGVKYLVNLKNRDSWNSEVDSDDEPQPERVNIDTSITGMARVRMAMLTIGCKHSYVNPNLSTSQKAKIKENECKNNKFAGVSRSGPKTSTASGSSHSFTLNQFVKTLPKDNDMSLVISELDKPWKTRAIQENKNVVITALYLFAYAKESDNDYHLILTNKTQTVYFNAEISALPSTSSPFYNAIKKVRNDFETWPGGGNVSCGSGYFDFGGQMVKIKKLKGSIFFDTDHCAGTIGPSGHRPETAWEIHPITYIEF